MITSGSRRLEPAASTRKMTISAKPRNRELVSFLHVLPGIREVVVAKSGRSFGLALEEIDRLPTVTPALAPPERRGIQLVVVGQRVRSVPVSIETTVDSGTCWPVDVAT